MNYNVALGEGFCDWDRGVWMIVFSKSGLLNLFEELHICFIPFLKKKLQKKCVLIRFFVNFNNVILKIRGKN